jgi:hypothetical protein
VRRALSLGLVALALAVMGVLLFGLVHAALIVPIWDRLLGGLPFAIGAGLAMAWCYSVLRASASFGLRARDGLRFGLLLWLSIVPVTLLAAALRLTGTREQLGGLEAPLELVVGAAAGAFLGWWLGRSRWASGAFAAASASLVLVMAGPIALPNGLTEVALFGSFLPIYLCAGLVLVLCVRRLERVPAEEGP